MKNKSYKIFLLTLILTSFTLVYTSCKRHHDFKDITSKQGTCSDGIQNQDETSIDCGGVCGACQSCTDGVKNGTETGVDCGGGCSTCTSPCISYTNSTHINMGGAANASVYAYIDPNNSSHIIMDVNTNAFNISGYDIYLGSNTFASLGVGAQQVYTTVDPNIVTSVQGGQASVTITQTGFNYAQYYGAANSHIYFKRITATQMQVWFCNLGTTDVPSNGYAYTVGANF